MSEIAFGNMGSGPDYGKQKQIMFNIQLGKCQAFLVVTDI